MTAPTSIVNGVDFVSASTKDLEAAREFYGTVLGLPCSSVWGGGESGRPTVGAEFETGGLTIALIDSEKVGLDFQPNNHPIALHVDDFEAARGELESRGVTFLADTLDSGVCLQAFFKDPDGNALALHHRYAHVTEARSR